MKRAKRRGGHSGRDSAHCYLSASLTPVGWKRGLGNLNPESLVAQIFQLLVFSLSRAVPSSVATAKFERIRS